MRVRRGPARPRPLRDLGRPEGGCQLRAVGLVVPPRPGSPRVSTPRATALGGSEPWLAAEPRWAARAGGAVGALPGAWR